MNKLSTRLIRLAQQTLKNAYAPYSGYRVGAALLAQKGRIFTGSNIENASYGLTVCAERVAVFKAVSAGVRKFRAMAIAVNHVKIPRPCGACLQVLQEFSPVIELILVNNKGRQEHKKLSELLPYPFKLKQRDLTPT